MSNPTSNYAFVMPTPTDLVTDLPADFEVFGQAVDTQMKTNADAATQKATLTAKGDLYAASAASTPARLAVGTNGQVLTADSTAATGVAWATPSAGSNTFYAGKNKIINGDFYWNQRGFTTSTTSTAYGFDRFMMIYVDGTVTYSAQTFTPGTAPVAGYEGKNFARIVTTGQTLTSARANWKQPIENVRTLAGQTATVSFWAKAGSGTPKIAVELWQGFGSGGSPSSGVPTYAGQVTLSTSWARYSVTVAVPSIAGKTIGTTENTSELQCNLFVSAGSDLNSRTGSLGIQSNTFDIWGVQVEAGSTATDFQTASGSIGGELALCQRYYFQDAKAMISIGYSTNGYNCFDRYYHPVQMRTTPTITQTGAVAFSSNTSATTFTIDASGSNEIGTSIYFLTGASNGLTYLYRPVQWSAEL